MEWHHQYRIFKLASVKSVKTAAFSFLFIYFKYYGQNIYRK